MVLGLLALHTVEIGRLTFALVKIPALLSRCRISYINMASFPLRTRVMAVWYRN